MLPASKECPASSRQTPVGKQLWVPFCVIAVAHANRTSDTGRRSFVLDTVDINTVPDLYLQWLGLKRTPATKRHKKHKGFFGKLSCTFCATLRLKQCEFCWSKMTRAWQT